MKSTLIDAGPLIALFDKDDRYHTTIISFLEKFEGFLYTSWPVITEVSYMLSFNTLVQIDFLKWINRDAITIVELKKESLNRMIELSQKYSNVPMDLADSSMIAISEIFKIQHILTFDSDFYAYKTKSKKTLQNLLMDVL